MHTRLGREQWNRMDVESLANLVFRFIKEKISSNPYGRDFCSVVNIRRELLGNPGGNNRVKLTQAIRLLESRDLIVRDTPDPPRTFIKEENDIVELTTKGIESNPDRTFIIGDAPSAIINELEQDVGKLDVVVKQYYLESLRAHNAELYIASILCLGVASERAVDWFAESVKGFCPASFQKTLENKMNQNISSLTKYLSDTIIPAIFDKNEKTTKDLRKQLGWHAQLYRENRNEAGHPQEVVQNWSEEDQWIPLRQFPRFIIALHKAIEVCREKSANQNLATLPRDNNLAH